jgi:hypothetical protein
VLSCEILSCRILNGDNLALLRAEFSGQRAAIDERF